MQCFDSGAHMIPAAVFSHFSPFLDIEPHRWAPQMSMFITNGLSLSKQVQTIKTGQLGVEIC